MCSDLLQSGFNFAAKFEHVKDNIMEMKRTSRNHSCDVSNKIVGKEEIERLIADYEGKNTGMPMKGKLDYLRSASSIAKVRIISFPLKDETRTDAIIREYKEYSQMQMTHYNRFAFCIEYSMKHPLLMDEEQRLGSLIDEICPADSMKFVYSATDETLNDKVLLTIIGSN